MLQSSASASFAKPGRTSIVQVPVGARSVIAGRDMSSAYPRRTLKLSRISNWKFALGKVSE
jgi:hypothetical protein